MKKYLIWTRKGKVCMDDGDSFMESFRNRWDYVDSIGAGEYLCGRIVTLDHEPTPAEVRTLLEGPDPLSECLDAIRMVVLKQGFDFAGTMRSLRFSGKEVDALESLLEKYREGGK